MVLVRRPHRLFLYDYLGEHCYSLTISTYRRRRWFEQPWAVRITWKQFLHVAKERSFSVFTYCFMPDHFHALVLGESPDSNFRAFVRLAKQTTSHQFLKFTGNKLWKDGYWDRTLRGNRPSVDVVRYIVLNPVRAGLVSNPIDYPFWGSESLTRQDLLDLIGWSHPPTDGSPDL
jgi:REP element-mobilizing transposase RayT